MEITTEGAGGLGVYERAQFLIWNGEKGIGKRLPAAMIVLRMKWN